MAIPTIRSVGTTSGTVTGQGRNNLVIGETVTLSDTNGANTGFGHVWSFIDKPINSLATLSTPTSATSTFVPDVTGSYFIQCTVNGTDIGKQIIAVPLPNTGARIPAFSETIEYTGNSNVLGWHETMTNFLRVADSVILTAASILGNLIWTAISPPGTPTTGKANVYIDSTAKNLAVKNDAGTVTHTVKTKTVTTHQFLTGVTDAGDFSAAQVAASDITGLSTVATSGVISDLTGLASPSIIPSQIILSSALSGSNAGSSTSFMMNGGFGSTNALRYPTSAKTISKLRVTLLSNTISVNVTVTLFKNGSATAQTITILPTDTAFTKYLDAAHPITFADNDDFDVRISCPTDASAGTCEISVILE